MSRGKGSASRQLWRQLWRAIGSLAGLVSDAKKELKAGKRGPSTKGTSRPRKGVPLGKSMRSGSGGGSPWTPPDDPWTVGAPGGPRWGGDRRGTVLAPPDDDLAGVDDDVLQDVEPGGVEGDGGTEATDASSAAGGAV